MGNLAKLKFSNEDGEYHMKVINNPKLQAIDYLESPEVTGISIYLGSRVKTATYPDGDYLHAETLAELAELMKVKNADTD